MTNKAIQIIARSAGRYICGEGGIPHVWETHIVPPPPGSRCICGLLTWKEGATLALWKAQGKGDIPPETSPIGETSPQSSLDISP